MATFRRCTTSAVVQDRPQIVTTASIRGSISVIMVWLLGSLTGVDAREPGVEKAIHLVRSAKSSGGNLEQTRLGVEKLVSAGSEALPLILRAIPADDNVVANWLRSAYDRIVSKARKEKVALPLDRLREVLLNPKESGFARRLALQTLDEEEPSTVEQFLQGAINDPEFNSEAVARRLTRAAEIEQRDPEAAKSLLFETFEAANDFGLTLTLANRLQTLGKPVDAAAKLGVIREWLVVGPFDDPDETGYGRAFGPELEINPKAEYDGKMGRVRWHKFVSDAPDGRVNLLSAIGAYDAAIGYAMTFVQSEKEQQVEIRASGDDNLAVWVNGKKIIDHPTYRSHLRIDWHRASLVLRAGENVILVKVCQCPAPPVRAPGPPAKWEFLLRLVDTQGRGVKTVVNLPHTNN